MAIVNVNKLDKIKNKYPKTVRYCPDIKKEDALDRIEECKERAIKAWNIRIPMQNILERLEKLKEYERNGDCPKDGMCNKKAYECTSCYVSTAIEIVKEEGLK